MQLPVLWNENLHIQVSIHDHLNPPPPPPPSSHSAAPCKSDPWFIFAPSSTDARIIYAVHDGRFSSPPPMVCSARGVVQGGQRSKQIYDMQKRVFLLPALNYA